MTTGTMMEREPVRELELPELLAAHGVKQAPCNSSILAERASS